MSIPMSIQEIIKIKTTNRKKFGRHLGKILKWDDLLVVPFDIDIRHKAVDEPVSDGFKTIIIRSEGWQKVGDIITLPYEIVDTLEEFPAVLLWGFSQ